MEQRAAMNFAPGSPSGDRATQASDAPLSTMSHARYALSDDEEEKVPTSSLSSRVELTPALSQEAPREVPDEPAVMRLAHAWLNERGAPELQPWPTHTIDTVLDQLQQQQVRYASGADTVYS